MARLDQVKQGAGSQWQDFKKFAFKGNLIDLAVAVVIGGAFGKVIDSLVKNVLMPLLGYITPGTASYREWKIGRIEIGVFLSEIVNFLIIAAALYVVITLVVGRIQRAISHADTGEPTTKECPLCLSNIPYKARKCAQCTADLPAEP